MGPLPPPLGSWNYNGNADTNKQLKACTVVSDAEFFVAVCSIKEGLNKEYLTIIYHVGYFPSFLFIVYLLFRYLQKKHRARVVQ